MNDLACAQMDDLIDELALDVLPGDRRALALAHLEGCAACRGRLEELSESADQLLFAYRPIDPPPGFESRVLGRLSAERARPRRRPHLLPYRSSDRSSLRRSTPRQSERWPHRRWRLPALAAAAAVLAGLAVGGGVVFGGGGHAGPPLPVAAGPELRTVALVSASGHRIGDVSAYSGPPAWFFMRVDRGSGTGTYQCVLDVDGGASVWIGPMVISDGRGGWGQQVNIDADHVRSARLVDHAGATVAVATFH
jgi:hypothetical protein